MMATKQKPMACHSLIKLLFAAASAIPNNEAIKMLAFIFVHSSHLTIIKLLNALLYECIECLSSFFVHKHTQKKTNVF